MVPPARRPRHRASPRTRVRLTAPPAPVISWRAMHHRVPYDEAIRGREAIVSAWLGESDAEGASTRDEPGTWEADYRAIAVDGDARCSSFTEWYVERPRG